MVTTDLATQRQRLVLADGPRRGITVWPPVGADEIRIRVHSTIHVYRIDRGRAYYLFDRDARD